MRQWLAIVPMKGPGRRKSRLAPAFSVVERNTLAEDMCRHVLSTLRRTPSVGQIVFLSDGPPPVEDVRWRRDGGEGLNMEIKLCLAALDAEEPDPSDTGYIIIHADLPLLGIEEVETLIASAECGAAIAPDWRAVGTNALAFLGDQMLVPQFGPSSFSRHLAERPGFAVLAGLVGLELDVDTVEDLARAEALGRSSTRQRANSPL